MYIAASEILRLIIRHFNRKQVGLNTNVQKVVYENRTGMSLSISKIKLQQENKEFIHISLVKYALYPLVNIRFLSLLHNCLKLRIFLSNHRYSSCFKTEDNFCIE